jgi:FkbM family methyltransferase
VRERARFALADLRDSPAVGRYHLRESGLVAHARHPLLDMWVLEEVFALREYQPPPEVMAVLGALGRPVRILDLGGHVGYFGLFAHSLFPDATMVSFEPDPSNGDLLRRSIEANRMEDRWTLVAACAGAAEGTTEFASAGHLSLAGPPGSERLADIHRHIGASFDFMQETALLSPERLEVAVRDVFPYLADADFVKMDIEGSEWELLADPRFAAAPARALVLEYHPGYGPGDDAERVLQDVLGSAGYTVATPERDLDVGTLWAWRQ